MRATLCVKRFLFLLVVAYAIGAADASVYAFDLQIQNATGYDLHRLHAFSHDSAEIGPNLLDSPILTGDAFDIAVPETTGRLLAVDEEGDHYYVAGLGPRQRTQIVISLDDLFFGDPTGAGEARAVTLLNDTGYALVSVILRPAAVGTGATGVELLPSAGRVSMGDTFVLRVPPEYSGGHLFHLRVTDEDGDIYEKRRIDFRSRRTLRITVDDIRW